MRDWLDRLLIAAAGLGMMCSSMGGRAQAATALETIESNVTRLVADKKVKFCVSGGLDLRGNIWIGTEGAGIWRGGQDGVRLFTAADGLGDDDVYAIATDQKGRVWAGHSHDGVSVFNGTAWKHYPAEDGPEGSRVFAIAVCPTDGDVWIATEAGLARYSEPGTTASGVWSWFNRSNGLPDDQVSSMAFDASGNLYVGFLCDGVAVAKAAEHYQTWHATNGPDVMPAKASGDGLPGPLVNAMLATRSGAVYAGTTRGIAWTKDQGTTWQYLRGTNWSALVAASFDGAPKDMAKTKTPLKEEWTSCLAEDSQGDVVVGHRDKGYEALLPDTMGFVRGGAGLVRMIVPLADGGLVIGTYGKGALFVPGAGDAPDTPAAASAGPVDFPAVAKAPSADELDQMARQILALPPATSSVEVLTDDWETKGDWMGRYGREYSLFSGYHWEGDSTGSSAYSVSLCTGPYAVDANVYSYEELPTKIEFPENVLFNPKRKQRVAGEFNDGSFDKKRYPVIRDGPDLWAAVRVPEGAHRVSLYFFNQDGHTGGNVNRDFYLQVKRVGTETSETAGKVDLVDDSPDRTNGFILPGSAAIDAEVSETIARVRLPSFWNGGYKRMLIRGPGSFWIKIGRNYSFVTKLQGVFVDGEGDAAAAEDADPVHVGAVGDMNVPRFAGDATALPGLAGAAAKLWAAVDASTDREGYAGYSHPLRMAAYRAAVASGAADPKLLENWRWRLELWNDPERKMIDSIIDHGTVPADDNTDNN